MEKLMQAVASSKILFRSEISRGIEKGAQGVDRTFKHERGHGAIFGYAVITKGKLNEGDIRNQENDDTSLQQVIDLGNKSKMGIKSRFGHPNMSGEALGTFLGRAKNFRRDGDVIRADLFFDETAYKTPNGDLANYVMDLAESDPAAFGSSIVFNADYEQKLEKDGKPKKDVTGKELPVLVRFKSLFASDVVESPAATKGLFGKFFNESSELSAKATGFLDKLLSNPEALERVIGFLGRYRINRVEIDEIGEKENQQLNKEVVKMDESIKVLTIETLSSFRPDLLSKIQTEAEAKGIGAERARVLSIIKTAHIEFKGLDMEPQAEDAVEKGLTVDAALSGMRKNRLDALNAKANVPPGASADDPTKTPTHLERAKKYQSEHTGCSITEALKATAEVNKK